MHICPAYNFLHITFFELCYRLDGLFFEVLEIWMKRGVCCKNEAIRTLYVTVVSQTRFR